MPCCRYLGNCLFSARSTRYQHWNPSLKQTFRVRCFHLLRIAPPFFTSMILTASFDLVKITRSQKSARLRLLSASSAPVCATIRSLAPYAPSQSHLAVGALRACLRTCSIEERRAPAAL